MIDMKRRRKGRPDPAEIRSVDRDSALETIARFWLILFIVCIILYIAALVIGRTQGFRHLVAERLGTLLGCPVTIEKVVIDLFLNLQISELRENHVDPSFTMGHAEIKWRWSALFRRDDWAFSDLVLHDTRLKFSPDEKGTWQPLPQLASALAPWVGLSDFSISSPVNKMALTEWLRIKMVKLKVHNLNAVWFMNQGDEAPFTYFDGVTLECYPVKPFDENALWLRMQVRSARIGEESWPQGLAMEWIRLGGQDIILSISSNDTVKPVAIPAMQQP